MNEDQRKRVDRVVFPILLIVLGYIEFTMIGLILSGRHETGIFIQTVVLAAGIISIVCAFILKKGSSIWRNCNDIGRNNIVFCNNVY